MPALPDPLSRLLAATDPAGRDAAWRAFLKEYGGLIHLAARKAATDYDGLMDRYAYVLERLMDDDFRRLRAFTPGGRAKFTTWIVVVASRLCIDYRRSKYGRPANVSDTDSSDARRKLADLVGEDVGMDELADQTSASALDTVQQAELSSALEDALASLSGEDRLVMRLLYEDGETAARTARVLGMSSEFVVHRRKRIILDALRKELGARGVDGPVP